MNFTLSEDHQLLSNSLRRYLSDNYTTELRTHTAYVAPFHSQEIWSGLAELGIIGALISEEQGGFAGTAMDIAIIFEELGRSLCAEPLLGTLMGLRLLAKTQKNDLVAEVVAGTKRCAFAVFEAKVACDLSYIETTARHSGGKWLLSGRKSAVYGAPGADYVLVAARTEQQRLGVFLLERPQLISAGMIDGGGTAELLLDNVVAECLLPDACAHIEEVLDLSRIALCSEAVGAMSQLIDLTTDYLMQRKQFGRAIGTFQALQHRLVDMVVEREQCRSITLAAIAEYDGSDRGRFVSMAKNLIGRSGIKVAEEAIQMHGGIGITWEYIGSHYAKRLIMIDHQLGDQHDHLLRVLGTKAPCA